MQNEIWNVNLTDTQTTYTVTLSEVSSEVSPDRKHLQINCDNEEMVVNKLDAIVEYKPGGGVHLTELTLKDQTLKFADTKSLLIPIEIIPGRTWEVDGKKSSLLLTVSFTMKLRAIKTDPLTTVEMDLRIKVTSLFHNIDEKRSAIITVDNTSFKPTKVEFPDGVVFYAEQ